MIVALINQVQGLEQHQGIEAELSGEAIVDDEAWRDHQLTYSDHVIYVLILKTNCKQVGLEVEVCVCVYVCSM